MDKNPKDPPIVSWLVMIGVELGRNNHDSISCNCDREEAGTI
jgi:hypothetical protein